MNATELETSVRLVASPQSWIDSEALRQLHATARLDGMRLAVGLPICIPAKAGQSARCS